MRRPLCLLLAGEVICRPRGIRERDDSLLANSRQAAPGFFARTSVDEARNGANYTLLNLNHPVTGYRVVKNRKIYVYTRPKNTMRESRSRKSLTFFLAFSPLPSSFLHRFRILQIPQDERGRLGNVSHPFFASGGFFNSTVRLS